MRSGNSRSVDFVQDYAAKRQAQLERAKKLREERAAHQQQGSSGVESGASSMNQHPGSPPTNDDAMMDPPLRGQPPQRAAFRSGGGSGAGSPLAAPYSNANAGRVLNVVEDDFKQAAQSGIITPDQARQLWAMLSNQIIRVAPPSHSNVHVTTVDSLMALSRGSNASSSMSSSGRQGHPSTGSATFGASISLESLRQSIAQFKAQQRRMGGGGGGGNAAPSRASPPVVVNAQPPQQQQPKAYVSFDDMPVGGGNKAMGPPPPSEQPPDVDDDRAFAAGARRQKTGMPSSSSSGKKPGWNYDATVDYPEGADQDVPPPLARGTKSSPAGGAPRKLSTRAAAASHGDDANVETTSTASSMGGGKAGGGRANAAAPKKSNVSAASPLSGSTVSTSSSAAAVAAAGGTRRTTMNITALDDMPVGKPSAGGGGGGFGIGSSWDDAYPPGQGPSAGGAGNGRGGAGRSTGAARATPPAVDDIPATAQVDNSAIERAAAAAAKEPLKECSICGRSFRVSVLARHETVCRKQANKPRRVFNMQEQRLDGVEGIEEVQRKVSSPPPRNNAGASKRPGAPAAAASTAKMPKWKVQHEQFQAAMRAVKQQNEAAASGPSMWAVGGGGGLGGRNAPPPPAPLPAELDDRVPCPHCGRKFAEDVAARHIPKCATTVAKPKGIRPIRR